MWQDKVFDGEIIYPESFNLRDWANDLQMLNMAKASGVKSDTFIAFVKNGSSRSVVQIFKIGDVENDSLHSDLIQS